jgi:tetratricopeptide (TPR) repeat protein
MSSLDFPPKGYEVEDQLKRMLASPRFRNAPNPSAFLELGVTRALKGKRTPGRVIAAALFGGKFIQGESPDVRVTAKNLRKTLERYYENEGSTDVVIISYPEPLKDKTVKFVEGEAYTPRFAYNPKHETFIQVRLGYRFLEQSTYRDYCNALNIFTGILENDPDNLGALLGLTETFCKFGDNQWAPSWRISDGLVATLCGEGENVWKSPSKVPALTVCISIFAKLEKRAGNYWRYWAARAYFDMRKSEAKLVASYYEKALKLNRTATESFIPYIEFLVETNKRDEALGLAQRYVNERVEDSLAVAQYGYILCLAGRQDVGIGHLQAALHMDPGNCLAHQSLATIRLMQRDVDAIFVHLQALRLLCDAESFTRFSSFLEMNEEQYELKGCIANLLSRPANGDSEAIVKS